jgi:hypothetical protein
MAAQPLSEQDCIDAVNALKAADGNQTRAAHSLGIPRPTFQSRLHTAALRGFCGTDPVIPGFGIRQVSRQTDASGALQKEWVKQGRLGEEFVLPAGHVIKGVSALTDADGRLLQQWVKTRFDEAIVDVTAALTESFKAYKGHATLPSPPRHPDRDTVTVYPIGDHHLGLYTWKPVTGNNYDLSIGQKLLMDTMASLVADAPSSKTGVILNLGDFFHSDNDSNRTPKSGHALDVDGRYAKILRVGVDLLIHCIQLALQRHERVIVRCLPGNHDPYASLALATALGAFFSKSPRVLIDTDASPFFKYRFDKVLIASAHGDMIKATDMPGFVAATWPEDWGATRFRYVYLGHVHHKSIGGGEKAGVIWETFQTLAPKDIWHHSSGYVSGRSMVSITHHREKGEIKRSTVSVKE